MSSSPVRRVGAVGVGALATLVAGALIARSRLPVRDDPTDADISVVSIFGGTQLRPTSDRFRGGSVVSMFGGTRLDLRRAELDNGEALLSVTTVFGGTEITVPDGWHVHITGPSLFGGVRRLGDEPGQAEGAQSLEIQARTVFGGLQVIGRPVLRAADAS